MTGRRYTARGEEFDTAVLFGNRNHLVVGIVSIVEHFHNFGTEIHTGVLEPRENSKPKSYSAQNHSHSTTHLTHLTMLIYQILS